MSHLIKSATVQPNFCILVGFIGGVQKLFDLSLIEQQICQFKKLREDNELFKKITVDAGGYGVSWDDELDLDAETIWEKGTTVTIDVVSTSEALASELVRMRAYANLTQKQLSEKTGIYQADISKYEHGQGNPSVQTLERLAKGAGMQMEIRFVPRNDNKTISREEDELDKVGNVEFE